MMAFLFEECTFRGMRSLAVVFKTSLLGLIFWRHSSNHTCYQQLLKNQDYIAVAKVIIPHTSVASKPKTKSLKGFE